MMRYFGSLVVALLPLGVMPYGHAGNGENLRGAVESRLGITLPHGFEATREIAEGISVLQVFCGPSYERFSFKNNPAPPEEVMEAVLARLVGAGYRVYWVFDQFLEHDGIVIVLIFSSTGDEAYHLLFDYDRRLFHPVGPCPGNPEKLTMPGVDRGEGVLEPGGTVRLLEEVTVVDDTSDFLGPQLVVVERVLEGDLPLAFPNSENRVAPFYRFSSDEVWWANSQGLQARVWLPEGADAYGLAVQMYIAAETIDHDLGANVVGFWAVVPATYDSETHEAVFSLRALRPEGLYITFSSGNFPTEELQ